MSSSIREHFFFSNQDKFELKATLYFEVFYVDLKTPSF